MATTIELCMTPMVGSQDSLIGSLNDLVSEMNIEGITAGQLLVEWNHVRDVEGGFEFVLKRGDKEIARGTVRSDLIRRRA